MCACSGESAWENCGPFRQAGVRKEVGGWVEWRMGCVWEPCPIPPVHCWKEPGRCQFAMQISPLQTNFGKRSINGWHRAGLRLWQMSFPFWFLTPFLQIWPAPAQKSLPSYCVLQSQPTLSFCKSHSRSGEKNTKFSAPIHIRGSNCHPHWDGVKYVKIRIREKENWEIPSSVRWEANVVNYRGHYRYTLICH